MNEAQSDLGNPQFIWNGISYPCIPSVNQFERELETGGFIVDKLLTMTVPLTDGNGNQTFPNNTAPDTQQLIQYLGEPYRIKSTKYHPTLAYIRLVAVCTTRGI